LSLRLVMLPRTSPVGKTRQVLNRVLFYEGSVSTHKWNYESRKLITLRFDVPLHFGHMPSIIINMTCCLTE
jgi:hypothetical protein